MDADGTDHARLTDDPDSAAKESECKHEDH